MRNLYCGLYIYTQTHTHSHSSHLTRYALCCSPHDSESEWASGELLAMQRPDVDWETLVWACVWYVIFGKPAPAGPSAYIYALSNYCTQRHFLGRDSQSSGLPNALNEKTLYCSGTVQSSLSTTKRVPWKLRHTVYSYSNSVVHSNLCTFSEVGFPVKLPSMRVPWTER